MTPRKSKREIEKAVEELAPADAVRRSSSDIDERHREAVRAALEHRYDPATDVVGSLDGDAADRRAFLADAAEHVAPDHAVVIRETFLDERGVEA